MISILPEAFRRPLVNVVRLSGLIAAAPRGQLSDQAVAPVLEAAFRRGRPRAVALVVNSPGGSSVQASLIASRIRRLAEETRVPTHTFVEDVAASGGYWIACAADRIWVDPASIVGSIGVIHAGFGFHAFLDRHGIERRVHVAGRHKDMLDPFRPERAEDVRRLEALQKTIHTRFIAHVRARRGTRLREDEEPLFEGDIWLGERAVELGLADEVGHLVPAMKALCGEKVRFRVRTPRVPFLRRLGARVAGGALALAEERAAFARFGL